MTLKRLVVVLGATLAGLLAVVMLRAENRRLHYLISQQDQRADALVSEIREKELELARLSNPRKIRERAAALRMNDAPLSEKSDVKPGKKRPSAP